MTPEELKHITKEIRDLHSSIIILWDLYLKKVNEFEQLTKEEPK